MPNPRLRLTRSLATIAAAIVAATAVSRPAHAQLGGIIGGLLGGPQIVFDPTAVGKLVSQLHTELRQLDVANAELQQQLIAMRKLPHPPWRDIARTMQALDAVARDRATLAYAVPALDQAFGATFPVTRVVTDWPTEERTRAARTVATMRAALDAASAQGATFSTALDRLARMKSAVATIQGHEQALELQNAASVFGAEELVLLRQALAMQGSAQAVYFADRVNAEAERDATVRAALAGDASPQPSHALVSLRLDP